MRVIQSLDELCKRTSLEARGLLIWCKHVLRSFARLSPSARDSIDGCTVSCAETGEHAE